jgi:GYF domain 2/Domain of unknown function (DUF4282)
MADWWYTKNGERQGPVSSSQLRQLAQSGELLPTDMVFKEGGTEWKLATTVSNLFPPSGAGSSGSRTDRPTREDRDRGGADFDDRDDDDRPSKRSASGGSSGGLMDLMMFRRMIAPTIIIIVFWVGIIGTCLAGLGMIIVGTISGGVMGLIGALFGALIGIPITALMIRLYAELAILLFRMNETLTDIKKVIEKDQRPKS